MPGQCICSHKYIYIYIYIYIYMLLDIFSDIIFCRWCQVSASEVTIINVLLDCFSDITFHYTDVIMTTMVSQITSLKVVYSTVYSDVDQRKHQSSASLAFVWGIHRDRWLPHTKGQLRGKCFHLMTSSCCRWCPVSASVVTSKNVQLDCSLI